MSKKKINDLTLAGALSNTMQFETDIAGTTANKINLTQLKTYVEPTAAEIEVGFNPSHYTPVDMTVKGHLQGINSAIGTINTNINGIDVELATAQGDIMSINSDITTINTALSSSNNIPADYSATNYIPASNSVKGHLQGINSAFGTINTTLSSSNNIPADYSATSYTPASNSIKGHLQGINSAFGTVNTTLSSSNNIPADYASPTNYTPVSNSIKGHLQGINAALPTGTSRTFLFTTVTLNFGTVSAGTASAQSTTFTGAIAGDVVIATPTSTGGGCMFMGWINSANTLWIRCFNPTASGVAVNQQFKVCIIR